MLASRLLTRREILLGTVSVVVGHRLVGAQGSSRTQRPNFTVDVEVVDVFVTVRDKKGSIVKDLATEDFTLSEDGRPQTITFFSRESDLPLTIGLLVDTTPSESNMLDVERSASMAFLDRMLRPEKDKAFIIQYYSQTEVLQGLTSSREKLADALNRLEAHDLGDTGRARASGPPGGGGQGFPSEAGQGMPGGRGGQGFPGGRGRGLPGGTSPYENALADAIYLASDMFMKSQQGRKALFILGDGDHMGSHSERAITAAQQADTLIYTIRIYDKDFGGGGGGRGIQIQLPGMGGRGRGMGGGRGGGMGEGPGAGGPGGGANQSRWKKTLQDLAKQTGGAYFEVGKQETLAEIYAKIEEELRSQYNLGYTPDADARDGYRTIKIGVRRKGMVVRGREGYYPHPR